MTQQSKTQMGIFHLQACYTGIHTVLKMASNDLYSFLDKSQLHTNALFSICAIFSPEIYGKEFAF